MQGRENTGDDLVHHRVRRLLYPEDSGYRSETGGLMRCLRTLTAQTIRDYHRDYYRAENLCVIVTGKVDHGALLKALEKVDAKIVAKSASSGPAKARPWVDSPAVKPLAETVLDTIEFPDEEEATGSVTIGWHGVKVCTRVVILSRMQDGNASTYLSPPLVLGVPRGDCTQCHVRISHAIGSCA